MQHLNKEDKKMKKRISIIAAVLIIAMAVPVMAQEVTDPEKVYTLNAFNADELILIEDFHRMEVWRCENYLKYLDGVIYNLEETVRIKKEVVTNYKWLSQYNSYYSTLIPQAERDLAQAESWVAYYKQYRNAAQADLKARYKY